MAHVTIDDHTMTVHLEGLHRLWALRRRITASVDQVRGATVDPGAPTEPKGVRAPGLGLGRLATIGTFHRDGERHFWDVTAGGTPVVVELEGHRYRRLVLDVDDPRSTVDAVNAAVAGRRGA